VRKASYVNADGIFNLHSSAKFNNKSVVIRGIVGCDESHFITMYPIFSVLLIGVGINGALNLGEYRYTPKWSAPKDKWIMVRFTVDGLKLH